MFLHCAVNAFWKWQTGGFQHSRRNVGYVSELGANFPIGFNSRRPMDHDSVSSATVMRSDLLGPPKWRIASPCPADSVMWKGRRVAPVIEMRHVNLGGVDDPIQRHHFVIGAFWSALGARSIIAGDINEQRVTKNAHFLQRIE